MSKVLLILKGMKARVFFAFFVFFYVFNVSHPILNTYGIKFNFRPDSASYITTTSLDPWKVYRTPGYPLISALFFSSEKRMLVNKGLEGKTRAELFGNKRQVEKIYLDNGLGSSFSSLAMFQRIVQAFAISFFFFTLCEFVSPLLSLCATVIGLYVILPANPYDILTESISQSLIFICLACLFSYKSYKNFLWLYLATISALAAWVIRPVCLFLIGICFVCCIYFFYRNHFHNRIKYCINIFLLLFLPAANIIYLSLPVGRLLVSTVQDQTDLGRVLFFLEPEDIENMPTHRSKLFAQAFLDNYPNFEIEAEKVYQKKLIDRASSHSLPYRYLYLSNPYIYVGTRYPYKVIRQDPEIDSPKSILQKNIFVKELLSGIMKRHFYDNMKLSFANFLSGFGYYKDLNVSNIIRKFDRKIYALGWLILIGAIIFSKNVRYVLILLLMVHVGNLAACATHHPENRYIGFTEVFMSIAIILASLTLMRMFILFILKLHSQKMDGNMKQA